MAHDHRQNECCDHNTQTVESLEQRQIENSVGSTFFVSGMDCADEIAAIQRALVHPQIAKVTANLMTSQVVVDHHPDLEKPEIISTKNHYQR